MPGFEKSFDSKQSSSLENTSLFSKIIAFFNPNGSSVQTKSHKATVGLKTAENYKQTLFTLPNSDYINTAGCDLSSVFYPFQAGSGDRTFPTFSRDYYKTTGSGFVDFNHLLPYMFDHTQSTYLYDKYLAPSGDINNDVVSAELYYKDIDRLRDISNFRSIGLKLPLVGVGWGYTHMGQPIPSGISVGKFTGELTNGYMVDPVNFIAAPIDLRYDTIKNVWSSPTEDLLRPCSVIQDGGTTSGSKTTQCNLTYTVKDTYGNIMKKNVNLSPATGMSPSWGRPTIGLFNKATIGTYYRSRTGDLVLYKVNELPGVIGRSC